MQKECCFACFILKIILDEMDEQNPHAKCFLFYKIFLEILSLIFKVEFLPQ